MAGYVSEITQFIRKLKADNPAIEQEQARGRQMYWDKAPIDLQQRSQDLQGSVPRKAYPYLTDSAQPEAEQTPR